MREKGIKVWELSLLLALCISLCWGIVESGRQTALSEKIIRLHVIASGDSDDEQALKMRVKEAVVDCLQAIMDEAENVTEAAEIIESRRKDILSAATSAAEGEDVELIFGKTRYDSRYAEGYALPAGEYTSLRIVIGQGAGRNWWGVIFPQLGSGSTVDHAEAVSLLDSDELALIHGEGGYEVRFKLLELLEKLREWFG